MLDAEAALARAHARVGAMPSEYADQIAAACRELEPDPAELARGTAEAGTPVIPLVRALTAAVEGPAAGYVHRGATSQDIVDTASMLVASRWTQGILADLTTASNTVAELAETHRDTVQVGRTLLQQAAPTTFGALAAGWLSGLDSARERLSDVRRQLAVQLGGPVGTLESMGENGLDVLAAFAAELDLAEPVVPWHTERGRIADLAGALGRTSGVVGKVARDVVLLAQTEVGELAETGGDQDSGGSSSLPHKRNPAAAISVLASTERVPGLVSTLYGTMAHELQRAAGSWQAEWHPMADLLDTTAGAVARLCDCLARLDVRVDQMRANLERTGGLVLAERITTALAPELGRQAAHDLVSRACQDALDKARPLSDVLDEREEIPLSREEILTLLDPSAMPGLAGAFVDRALAAHRRMSR